MFSNPKKLRLFRGDCEEIDEFSFHKTRKSCLVGQGIYLTNKEQVADTYRVKGLPWRKVNGPVLSPIEIIFDGEAKDRNDAIEKSFQTFCERHEPKLCYNGLKQHQKKVMLEQLRQQFEEARLEGRITAEYVGNTNPRFPRTLRVKYDTQVFIGKVSVFEFPEKEFNDAMLDVYHIADPDILGMFFDAGVTYGTPYETRDDYVRHNLYNRWSRANYTGPKANFAAIRRVVEPFGYRGFEYAGGLHIGGHGRHRAFCVWHDEWVNNHLVHKK